MHEFLTCFVGYMDGLLPLLRGRTSGKNPTSIDTQWSYSLPQLSLCLRNTPLPKADEQKDDKHEKSSIETVAEVAA